MIPDQNTKKASAPAEQSNMVPLAFGLILISGVLVCLAVFISSAIRKKESAVKTRYENGELKTVENYDKGQLDGLYKQYYENGKIMKKVQYKDGKKEGPEEIFDDAGQLKEEIIYRDDKRNGFRTLYYQNGLIRRTENYEDDILKGDVHGYYKDGKLSYERKFDESKEDQGVVVIYNIYYPSGGLKKRMHFKADRQEGDIKAYYQNGVIKREIVYKEGKQVSFTSYDQSGEVIPKKEG